jgi:hypothetical protein
MSRRLARGAAGGPPGGDPEPPGADDAPAPEVGGNDPDADAPAAVPEGAQPGAALDPQGLAALVAAAVAAATANIHQAAAANANQAAAAAATAAVAAAMTARPQGAFGLAPGMGSNEVVDINSSTGIKIWQEASKPLDEKFDGSEAKVFGFVKAVQKEVVKRGWTQINTIPKDGQLVNWIPIYAQFTLAELKAHVLTYVGQQSRQSQNSFWMYQFLRSSLEANYFARLAAGNGADYTVLGNGSGVLLLKAILSDVHHDLKGKGSAIREQLMELPKYMVEASYDLQAFNARVNQLVGQLEARGETSTDLIHYLWKAYAVVPDTKFTTYINQKKDGHDEGSVEYTYKQLLKITLDKAEIMKSQGEWLKNSPQGEQIVALTAKIQGLEKRNLQLQDRYKKGGGAGNPKGKVKPDGKHPNGPKDKKPMPDWKKKKTGETKVHKDPKTGKTTTYYWCPYHKYFTAHKPSDCRDKPTNAPTPPPPPPPVPTPSETAAQGVVRSALAVFGVQE